MLNLELHTQYRVADKASSQDPKIKKTTESNLSPDHKKAPVSSQKEKQNLLGLDNRNPLFGWKMQDRNRKNILQTAYHIQVVTEDGDEVWNSGKIESNQSSHIKYPSEAPQLESGERYYWQVKVWYNDDEGSKVSEWSEETWFEMGLLNPKDWTAKWITTPENLAESDKAIYFLQTYEFSQEDIEDIRSGRLYISSDGINEITINDQVLNDVLFAPGHKSYPNTQPYQTADITPHLRVGKNTLMIRVAPGYFKGKIGGAGRRNVYGNQLRLLAQINLTSTKGEKAIIGTDNTWKVSDGPIQSADFKTGEDYDARLEQNLSTTDGANWKPVKVSENQDVNKLISTAEEYPIKPQREISNPELIKTPNGEWVLDFGENIAGFVEFTVEAKAGQAFKLIHGEVLDKKGNFTIENFQSPGSLPRATQEVNYTAKAGKQTYRPSATFFGFRYVKLVGFEEKDVKPENFKVIVIHSDLPRAGKIYTSNPDLNKYARLAERSLEGNLQDGILDGPTREEEKWSGDGQVLSRAVTKLFDMLTVYRAWLRDFRNEQRSDGLLYNSAPSAFLTTEKDENGDRKFTEKLPFPINKVAKNIQGSPGWADAITMIPIALYDIYGDVEVLRENYEAMKSWVGYMTKQTVETHWLEKLNPLESGKSKKTSDKPYILRNIFTWGEWLKPDANAATEVMTNLLTRPHAEVATAYYYHSTVILAEVAELLGEVADYIKYTEQAQKIAEAYQKEFIKENGHTIADTQDSYVRALEFGLIPEELHEKAVARLVELIEKNGCHVDTGFLSSGFILNILADNGYVDLAYKLLLQDTYPSWFFPMIKKGATTATEQWDSLGKNDKIVDPLYSHNHPAITAGPLRFMYEQILGIQEMAPGYKEIRIAPKPGGELTFAEGELDTIYGMIVCQWKIVENILLESGEIGDEFQMTVEIPGNTKATIVLPEEAGGEKVEVGSGQHVFKREWKSKDGKQRGQRGKG